MQTRSAYLGKGNKIFNLSAQMQDKPEGSKEGVKNIPTCSHCKNRGHTIENCFELKNRPCATCGGTNHATSRCLSCKLCADRRHKSVNCPVYKAQPVSGVCKICLETLNLRLFHPMSMCRNKDNSQKN